MRWTKWEWWIYCKKCGHWAKGMTENFQGWGCGKCGSIDIKGGIETVETTED